MSFHLSLLSISLHFSISNCHFLPPLICCHFLPPSDITCLSWKDFLHSTFMSHGRLQNLFRKLLSVSLARTIHCPWSSTQTLAELTLNVWDKCTNDWCLNLQVCQLFNYKSKLCWSNLYLYVKIIPCHSWDHLNLYIILSFILVFSLW